MESLDAASFATMSAVIPGLGQWKQGRRVTGVLQLGTVAAYLVTAIVSENLEAVWLAVLWNVWSCVDAFRHARREERWHDEEPQESTDA
ncbi:MAG TPA: hypothetical protein VLE53_15360 [Gemmatimonadaceae bacterium]|nr:hypothetical protein [Gemmatimonadaceae bacterium]